MEPTLMSYLDDTYLFESEATVLAVTALDDGMVDVALDRTIFYPQGGGQPCDHGTILTAAGRVDVTKVSLDPTGIIHHVGTAVWTVSVGDSARLAIDAERRILNARNHSAGHLIDVAVHALAVPDLVATKGYHFSDGPYVEYEGEVANPEALHVALQKKLAELVAENLPLQKRSLSPEEATREGVWAPPGKNARVVSFAGRVPCGCGGAHVRTTDEIGKIEIRKISFKKGVTRISYALAS